LAILTLQIYVLEKSDKAKTGKDPYIYKKVLSDDKKEIVIGSMPVMVKSKQCWLDTLDKSDCLYDSGGYFLVKGAEKVIVSPVGNLSRVLMLVLNIDVHDSLVLSFYSHLCHP